jgi:hypothetical protein
MSRLPDLGQLPRTPGRRIMIISKTKMSATRVLVVGDVMLDRYW